MVIIPTNFYFAAPILIISIILLVILAITDIRTYLLPNKLVAPFALLGIAFHIITHWHFVTPYMAISGCLTAIGILILFREMANYITGQDCFGMGDIKLLAAGGIWIGLEAIFLALAIGSFIGIIHGIILNMTRSKNDENSITAVQIPAGFGFSAGIIIAGIHQFLYNPPI